MTERPADELSDLEPDPNFSDESTEAVERHSATFHGFELTVLEGPAAGRHWHITVQTCSIGSHPSNGVVIDDPTVSRFHCEIDIAGRRARIVDLESSNGTLVDGLEVREAFLHEGSVLRLGRSTLRFESDAKESRRTLSEHKSFGSLVGVSVAMRSLFAILERASVTDSTILLEGETGTGKEAAADSIHRASPRAAGPFTVVDCGAIPRALLESELFGHERGAFTGASSRRVGAFEEAHGGTIFLDEIGELPIDLQPKLLRVIESREVRPVGSNKYQSVDVRLIAATHRDLRAEVNAGRFRSDLYYRLAVVKVAIPPLRERADDLPVLIDHLLRSIGAPAVAALKTPELVTHLRHATWPGNVRELRNYLERCLVFEEMVPVDATSSGAVANVVVDGAMPYEQARSGALAEFERRYVLALLRRHDGQASKAAEAAKMDRAYLYRLMRRYQIKAKSAEE